MERIPPVSPGRALLIALALLAFSVSACGGSGSADDNQAAGAGPNIGEPINLADCSDWNDASSDERLGTIHQLRTFVGGDVAGTTGRGTVLDDDEAYDLFENYCENDFARAFKLYKLYSRAAAFAGHAPEE